VLVHGTSVERFTFRFVEPLLSERCAPAQPSRRSTGRGPRRDPHRAELVAGQVTNFLLDE
jgi:hypothetical protein